MQQPEDLQQFKCGDCYISQPCREVKIHLFCLYTARPLLYMIHMCDLYRTVWNNMQPPSPPQKQKADSSVTALFKGRLTVFPKDRLTGDVLDESSVYTLLQRWYPPVSHSFPHKTLSCSSVKKKKEEEKDL